MRATRVVGGALWIAVALLLGGCSLFGHSSAASTTSTSTSVIVATSSTTTTTQAPTTPSSPSTSATTTTLLCKGSALSVSIGRHSVAAATVALGFVVTNQGAGACTLDGYPTILLVPASGTMKPVITDIGSTAPVNVAAGGTAGFVVEYGDFPVDGQTTCPAVTAVDVTLPRPGGTSTVKASFSPCGAPNVKVSAVLGETQYDAMLG